MSNDEPNIEWFKKRCEWLDNQLESAERTADHLRECLAKTEEKLAEYAPPFTDEPQQPAEASAMVAFPSQTVQRILLVAKSLEDGMPHSLLIPGAFRNWARELESAERRANNAERDFVLREAAIRAHQERIAELENGEWRVAWNQRGAEIAELQARIAELESREPTEVREVDWGKLDKAVWQAYGATPQADEGWCRRVAKAVIAACKASRPAAEVREWGVGDQFAATSCNVYADWDGEE